ncbi:hypothetical protein VP01_1949g1 [Puccinia sorghi]|uniref:Uncharacterized protein n=1 Tax=Puccinia sorghi TaxID=27349 RepID=A0A0L6VCR2_9BASI|nr:hypothetical protein VP01_1949g1 [Puccinia sorghi]
MAISSSLRMAPMYRLIVRLVDGEHHRMRHHSAPSAKIASSEPGREDQGLPEALTRSPRMYAEAPRVIGEYITVPQGRPKLSLILYWKIICVSDQSGRTGVKVEQALYLTADEVKAKVIETYSELDLRHFLEEIPQFYKYKSTVFPDLDQRNAMKDDYILMNNQLQSIRNQFHLDSPKSMGQTYFSKVAHAIEQLKAFQILIQKGTQDRIYKMRGQGSHIQGIEIIGIGENNSVNKNTNIDPPSSEKAFPRDWGLDIGEQIIQKTWDGQVDKMSSILHGLQLMRNDDQKFIQGSNKICFDIQNLLLKQVDYMYKQKMISGEAFRKFCQSKITLKIAAFNMIHTTAYSDYIIFRNLSPTDFLNKWTSENYRNIYEVLDDKNRRYFSYVSLKEFDYPNRRIKDFDAESLFKEDKLFHTLENLVSLPRNLYSRMKLQELKNQNPNYLQIEKSVQELISIFQDNEDDPLKNKRRERSFSFLDFIKTQYGFEMFELEKGDKFEEKMSLMSSSFQLVRELKEIYSYLGEKVVGMKISENNTNKKGEEILMIYKLSKYLISKHQKFILNTEIEEQKKLGYDMRRWSLDDNLAGPCCMSTAGS